MLFITISKPRDEMRQVVEAFRTTDEEFTRRVAGHFRIGVAAARLGSGGRRALGRYKGRYKCERDYRIAHAQYVMSSFQLSPGLRQSAIVGSIRRAEADSWTVSTGAHHMSNGTPNAPTTERRMIAWIGKAVRVEGKVTARGPAEIIADYVTFQGWMTEKKIFEGHSEKEAMALPTRERLDEMLVWIALGKPNVFTP